ncbi:hypothetical protein ACHAWU_008706 [Discostella pseudostelligera]|uniref:Uncharacterized protein n=1 Tax=Discostella pseudostelligera TaxID=259834 RepID=A0ABD3MA53_9STRA
MMSPTTLFNILCVIISILASSTIAQLGNWDILFQSLETDFQDAMTDIITLKYQIGSGRKFIVELMEKIVLWPYLAMLSQQPPPLTGRLVSHPIMTKWKLSWIWRSQQSPRLLFGRTTVFNSVNRSFMINFVAVTDSATHITSSRTCIFIGATSCIVWAFLE